MITKIILGAITAAVMASYPLTAMACTATHAIYTLDGSPAIRAHLEPLGSHGRSPGETALVIESTAVHKKIWYLFETGSGPSVHLISTEDVSQANWTPPAPDGRAHRPLFDTEYLETSEDDHFLRTRVPHVADEAAAKLLVVDLSEALKLGGLTDHYVDQGFFKLSACAPA